MEDLSTERLEEMKKIMEDKKFNRDIDALTEFVADNKNESRLELIDNFHFELDSKGNFVKNSIRITISKKNLEKLFEDSGAKGKSLKTLKKLKSMNSSSVTLALIDGNYSIID